MMEQYELEHMEILRKLAPECMVLLKSDGSFPLDKPGKVALYGSGARNTIKGGTGSGDVNVRSFVTVEQGLEHAGFTVTTKGWLDAYDAIWTAERKEFRAGLKARIAKEGLSALMQSMGAVMPEPEYDLPMDGEGDTAVYVLTRVSGEGYDRHAIPGDFELTQTEIRDILYAQDHYEKFLLVLKCGRRGGSVPGSGAGGQYPAAVPDRHDHRRQLYGCAAGEGVPLRQAGLHLGGVDGLQPRGRLWGSG